MSDQEIEPRIALEGRDSAQLSPALAKRLRQLTPARIALRRTGISLATSEVLDFQLAHGRARDAVHAPLQPATLLAALRSLGGSEPILLHSAAPDRPTYLKRPDLGRKLSDASRKRLATLAHPNCDLVIDLAIVLADGLSALAVERNAEPLLAELLPTLLRAMPELNLAPICIVEQGRVAVGDEIAHLLSAEMVIVLIGERPGLSSPDSLGAYITWQPRPGRTTDAERNCISNIRVEGLSYPQAAARLLHYIREARDKRRTGVALKDPDEPQLALGTYDSGDEK
jgi:ethanolamine ammonia-lyase small subunit